MYKIQITVVSYRGGIFYFRTCYRNPTHVTRCSNVISRNTNSFTAPERPIGVILGVSWRDVLYWPKTHRSLLIPTTFHSWPKNSVFFLFQVQITNFSFIFVDSDETRCQQTSWQVNGINTQYEIIWNICLSTEPACQMIIDDNCVEGVILLHIVHPCSLTSYTTLIQSHGKNNDTTVLLWSNSPQK